MMRKAHVRRDKRSMILSTIALTFVVLALFGAARHASADTADTADTADAADSPRVTSVDGDTRYSYRQALGDTGSTQYAGRVWVDKTVTRGDESLTFQDPDSNAGTVVVDGKDSDFLVTYSALAASQSITGMTVPTDTVFILDMSASMTWSYDGKGEANSEQESRLYAMVQSVNQAIDALISSNPQNRVAVIAFNDMDHQLGGLKSGKDILGKISDGEYLQIETWDTGDESNTDDTKASVRLMWNDETVSTHGGTNIQAGLFKGMDLLADTEDTTAVVDGQKVTRVPNVVIMSDGAPTTFSSSDDASTRKYKDDGHKNECTETMLTGKITEDTKACSTATVDSGSWWSTNARKAIGAGDNVNPDSADGFMALLTAAYFKNKITENYYGSIDGRQANVYTVGFASSQGQNAEMTMMSNIVLNPGTYLDQARNFTGSDNPDNNRQIQEVYQAAVQYLQGDSATVHGSIGTNDSTVDVAYKAKHADDPCDPKSLDYPTKTFTAEDGDQLEDALGQIASLINESAKSPTETSGDPDESGWITYVDPIGEHMHIDDVKTLIWAGLRFDNPDKGTDGEGDATYTFHGEIKSPVYGTQDVGVIQISLHTDTDQSDGTRTQTLTVRIPSAAIPVRVTSVTLDDENQPESIEDNGALPLRLIYGVSLDSDVTTQDGAADRDKLQTYLTSSGGAAHVEGDTAYFYANRYSGAADDDGKSQGDATATFQPADDNPYYFIQDDTPLYTDSKCTTRATEIAEDETYYYQFTYYEQDDTTGRPAVRTDKMSRKGTTLLGEGYTKQSADGLLIAAGTPRLGGLATAVADKEDGANPTGTASTVRYPTFTGDVATGSFVVHLGNNGRLGIPIDTVPADGQITVSKTIQGITSTSLDFDFDLTLDAQSDNDVPGKVTDPACVFSADGSGGWDRLPDDHTTTISIGGFTGATTQAGSFRLRFTKAGTYVFTLRENADDPQPGWTYDTTEHRITVAVEEADGALQVSEILYDGDPNTQSAPYTNTFASVSGLPLTGGMTPRRLLLAGCCMLPLSGAAWMLARRRRNRIATAG